MSITKIFDKMFDAFIFDLDGTLWDSTEVVAKAWSQARKKLNPKAPIVTKDQIRSICGLPYRDCITTLFPKLSSEQVDAHDKIFNEYEKNALQNVGGQIYPGVSEGIKTLSTRYPVFLLSNCQSWYLKLFHQHSNLEKYFTYSLCFGDTQRPKSENLLFLKDKFKLKNPIYIGDTLGDQKACLNSQTTFGYAKYGYGSLQTEFEFNNFQEVINFALLKNKNPISGV